MYKLNDFLNLTQDEIQNSKIELNMTRGRRKKPHILVWLESSEEQRQIGIVDCSYWGWFGKKARNYKPGQTVYSFVQLAPGSDKWLFVSAAKILTVPKERHSDVEILESFKPFFGKIIIQFKKGNTYSRYVFNLNNIIDRCTIYEVLDQPYNWSDFHSQAR